MALIQNIKKFDPMNVRSCFLDETHKFKKKMDITDIKVKYSLSRITLERRPSGLHDFLT